MTEFSLTPLRNSVANLLAEIEAHTFRPGDLDPGRLDRLARAIQSQLKTLETLEARALREAEQKRQAYTCFEDLPPPPPEERARMVKLLTAHFAQPRREPGDDAA